MSKSCVASSQSLTVTRTLRYTADLSEPQHRRLNHILSEGSNLIKLLVDEQEALYADYTQRKDQGETNLTYPYVDRYMMFTRLTILRNNSPFWSDIHTSVARGFAERPGKAYERLLAHKKDPSKPKAGKPRRKNR